MFRILLALAILLAFVPVAAACPPVVVQSLGIQSYGVQQFAAPVHCNAVAVQSFGAVSYSSPVVVQQVVPFAVNHHAVVVQQAHVRNFAVRQSSVVIQRQGRAGILSNVLGGFGARLQSLGGRGVNVQRSRSVQVQSFGY